MRRTRLRMEITTRFSCISTIHFAPTTTGNVTTKHSTREKQFPLVMSTTRYTGLAVTPVGYSVWVAIFQIMGPVPFLNWDFQGLTLTPPTLGGDAGRISQPATSLVASTVAESAPLQGMAPRAPAASAYSYSILKNKRGAGRAGLRQKHSSVQSTLYGSTIQLLDQIQGEGVLINWDLHRWVLAHHMARVMKRPCIGDTQAATIRDIRIDWKQYVSPEEMRVHYTLQRREEREGICRFPDCPLFFFSFSLHSATAPCELNPPGTADPREREKPLASTNGSS